MTPERPFLEEREIQVPTQFLFIDNQQYTMIEKWKVLVAYEIFHTFSQSARPIAKHGGDTGSDDRSR